MENVLDKSTFLHKNAVPKKLPLFPFFDNVYFSAAVVKISKYMPFGLI